MRFLRENLTIFRQEKPANSLLAWQGWIPLGIYVCIVFFSRHNPFFWDNVLNARAASWYYENGFSSLILPADLDAGHPPGFNLYLAGVWSLFGRSLPVSHFAMLPFLAGMVLAFGRLGGFTFTGILLLLLEPALLAQSTQVSPDLPLVCFTLLAISCILNRRRTELAVVLPLAAMFTFRGILILPALVILDLLVNPASGDRISVLKKSLAWIPVTVVVAAWLLFHYFKTGWITSPPPETWGTHRELASFSAMLKNAGVMVWRLMDNGRIVLWAIAVAAGWYAVKNKPKKSSISTVAEPDPVRRNMLLILLLAGTWGLFFIPFTNPIGHRYFIAVYVVLILLVSQATEKYLQRKNYSLSMTVHGLLVAALISGHFWIYPDTVAKGWDSNLNHIRWFSLREQMHQHLTQNHLHPHICTDFPNLVPISYSTLAAQDLIPDGTYRNITETPPADCRYIVQSNIMNGFSDELLAELRQKWILEKEFVSGPVYVRLYHNPEVQ